MGRKGKLLKCECMHCEGKVFQTQSTRQRHLDTYGVFVQKRRKRERERTSSIKSSIDTHNLKTSDTSSDDQSSLTGAAPSTSNIGKNRVLASDTSSSDYDDSDATSFNSIGEQQDSTDEGM